MYTHDIQRILLQTFVMFNAQQRARVHRILNARNNQTKPNQKQQNQNFKEILHVLCSQKNTPLIGSAQMFSCFALVYFFSLEFVLFFLVWFIIALLHLAKTIKVKLFLLFFFLHSPCNRKVVCQTVLIMLVCGAHISMTITRAEI